MAEKRLTIAFDLDGTLAEYHGYEGPFIFGPPNPGMKELFERLQKQGHDCGIYSCRNNEEVNYWCKRYDIKPTWINRNQFLSIDCINKPFADIYIDDKCIKFTGCADKLESEIHDFKEWWK